MESIGHNLEGLPEGSQAIEGPRVQRQVGSFSLCHTGSMQTVDLCQVLQKWGSSRDHLK